MLFRHSFSLGKYTKSSLWTTIYIFCRVRELARPLILGRALYSVPLPNQTLFSRLLFYWFVYEAFFLHVHFFPPVSAICSSRRRYLWWMQPNNVHKRKMLLIEFRSLSVLFILPYNFVVAGLRCCTFLINETHTSKIRRTAKLCATLYYRNI